MRKRNEAVLIVLPLLVLAGIAVFLSCSNQEEFSGSRVKNPDAYLLDIEKMNGFTYSGAARGRRSSNPI